MDFYKVNYEAFKKDVMKFLPEVYDKIHEEGLKEAYDKIELPKRATLFSAGYDFKSPFDIPAITRDNTFIPTGVKVNLYNDQSFLQIVPRSSSAKNYYKLGNTIGIIDADYFENEDNDGDIIICLRMDYHLKYVETAVYNPLTGKNNLITKENVQANYSVKQGDKIAQGIIMNYGITNNDPKVDMTSEEIVHAIESKERKGGFGSTGK